MRQPATSREQSRATPGPSASGANPAATDAGAEPPVDACASPIEIEPSACGPVGGSPPPPPQAASKQAVTRDAVRLFMTTFREMVNADQRRRRAGPDGTPGCSVAHSNARP